MGEFFKAIFGDYTFVQLFSFLWFFIIGYIIYALGEAIGRDKTAVDTPPKWNFKFWFKDNWRKYLVTFLSTYLYFRFYIQISGHPFGDFDAVTIGLVGNGIGAMLKEKIKAFSADRKELMTEYNADELKKTQRKVAKELKATNKLKPEDNK
jgi:hypothetical protein